MMTAQPPKPLLPTGLPRGLSRVSNIIAVSSCKVPPPPPDPSASRACLTLVRRREEWASRLWP